MTTPSDKAMRAEYDRVQQQVKACLAALRKSEDDFLGCLTVFILFLLIFAGFYGTDLAFWEAATASGVIGLGLVGLWSNLDDKKKKRLTDRAVGEFEKLFPPGEERRDIALAILQQMAGKEQNSYNKSANKLLVELGVELLPKEAAETQLAGALDQATTATAGDQAPPSPAAPKPPAAATGASSSTPPSIPAPENGQPPKPSRRFIPLEPDNREETRPE